MAGSCAAYSCATSGRSQRGSACRYDCLCFLVLYGVAAQVAGSGSRVSWSSCWLCLQSLLRNYEGDIDELSRKQKLSIEKVELAQTAEWKAFSKKFRVEQVLFLCFCTLCIRCGLLPHTYTRSYMVHGSVGRDREFCRQAEPTKMPFRGLTRMGQFCWRLTLSQSTCSALLC